MLAFCLIGLLTPAPAEDSIAKVIEGLQRKYAAVLTVSAAFRQVYRAPGIEQVESGILLMKKPGLMRWEYRDPERKLFVADGRETFLYTPEDRQVQVSRLSAAEIRSTPLQFLLGQGEILKSFTAAPDTEFPPSFDRGVMIRLTPRRSDPDYAFLVLECDRNSHELRRIIIRELTGNTSEFVLSNLVTNARVDGKEFQFKIPKGVEVIRLDQK